MNNIEGTRGTLYLVATAAGPTATIAETLVSQAMQRGWDVYCLATAQAAGQYRTELDKVEHLLGRPVRVDYHTATGFHLPEPDAVVVAPATYNTVNKWAAGIADTYVLTRLAELTGRGVPTAVLPFVNTAYAANPAFGRSIASLREAGVIVVYGPDGFQPHPPGAGYRVLDQFPWHLALDAVTPGAASRTNANNCGSPHR